jgi:hypothetical protein
VRCSFAVAWEVAQDLALLRVMGEPTGWQTTQRGARARA